MLIFFHMKLSITDTVSIPPLELSQVHLLASYVSYLNLFSDYGSMLSLALMSLSDPQPVGMGISASLLIWVTSEGCVLHSPSGNSHRVEPQLPTVASLLTYLIILSFFLWKWSQEARRQSSHVVPLNVNYRNCQLQIPTGKDVHCISSKTLATPTTQSMRTSSPWTPAFLQQTFSQNNPSRLPLFSL